MKSTKTLRHSNCSIFAFVMVDHCSIGAFSARGRAQLYRLPKKSFDETAMVEAQVVLPPRAGAKRRMLLGVLTARQESTPGLAGDGGAS